MISPASPDTCTAIGSGGGRLRRGWAQLWTAPHTWLLVFTLILAQLAPVTWDFIAPDGNKLIWAQRIFGLTSEKFFSGNLWQPFSYAMIHANWFHLSANLACILLLGTKLEQIIQKGSFWMIWLISALAGGALFIAFTAMINPAPSELPTTLVGSSAACFGFLVLLTTLSPDSRFIPLFLSGRMIGLSIILTNLILALIHPNLPTGIFADYGKQLVAYGLGDLFQVSHSCHLGGSLAGWFYGRWLLRPRVTLKSLQNARAKKEARSQSKLT